MERFVRWIVVGGVVLVGALWLVSVSDPGSVPWAVGLVVSVLGAGSLFAGIFSELEAGALRAG